MNFDVGGSGNTYGGQWAVHANLAVQKGLKLRHRAYGSSAGLTAADLQVSNGLSASALEPESMSLIVQPMLLAQSLS
jgi:hypothetical protein